MKTIVVLLLGIVLSNSNPRNDECLQLDIMMIVDFSGSLSGKEYVMVNGINSFTHKFKLSDDGVKMGLITFSNGPILHSSFTSDTTDLNHHVNNLGFIRADGSTYIGSALEMAMDQIIRYGRQDVKKIIVIITDGIPNDEERALQVGELLKLNGVVIGGVMIVGMYGYNEYFLRNLTTKNYYYETNFENLVSTLQKMNVCL